MQDKVRECYIDKRSRYLDQPDNCNARETNKGVQDTREHIWQSHSYRRFLFNSVL